MGGSANEYNRRPPQQLIDHPSSASASGAGVSSEAKKSDVPPLLTPAAGGVPGVGTIIGIGGEERIGTVIGICAWSDDVDTNTSVDGDQDRHYRRSGVGSGTRASTSASAGSSVPGVGGVGVGVGVGVGEHPTAMYSPGSARVIRWDDDGSVETVRWDIDAGIFDVTHVKIKNHRIATRYTHPLTRSQRVAARYFGQGVQYGVILRLRQQPLLPEDQAHPIVKRFVGLMEWPDFSGVVAVDGTGGSTNH